MPDPFLVVRHVSKAFSGVPAVENVSLTLERGKIYCLVGENGSGKSTLIKIISGVYKRDSGDIVLNGTSYKTLTPIKTIQEGVHVIYQDFALFPNLSVAENVAMSDVLARRRRFVNWKEMRRIARQVLEKINVFIDLEKTIDQLSIGERQLVAISRALQRNARLIIMDEPTTALTGKEIKTLFAVINKLCEEDGISFLFVSHKLNEVLAISEFIYVMRNGRLATEGFAGGFDFSRLACAMTGREEEERKTDFHRRDRNERCLLRVEGLSRRGAFQDISFQLHEGEILGFAGLLGSGRNELAQALFGLFPADSGEIWIDGNPAQINSVRDAISFNIAYIPEDRLTEGLFLPQSVGNNTIVRMISSVVTKAGLIDRNRRNDFFRKWMDRMAIQATSVDQPVQTLSGGNQQRVVLARWLAAAPRLFILNGPTVGMDIKSKTELHSILKQLTREGMGLIVISNDLAELIQICDRILFMRAGRITDAFERGAVTEQLLDQTLAEV